MRSIQIVKGCSPGKSNLACFRTPRFIFESADLTERQGEVLLWLAEGKTQRQIALIFGVGYKTIEAHLRHAKERLGVRTPEEALSVCFVNGIIRGFSEG